MRHYEKHLVKSQMYMEDSNYVKAREHYARAKELHPGTGFGAPWSSLTSWFCQNDGTMGEKLLEYKTRISELESELNRLYGKNDKREHEEIKTDTSSPSLRNKSGKSWGAYVSSI